jgi:hypothetical protein
MKKDNIDQVVMFLLWDFFLMLWCILLIILVWYCLLSDNSVLQTYVYILTISTSLAMPVTGYEENKDDDDDDH